MKSSLKLIWVLCLVLLETEALLLAGPSEVVIKKVKGIVLVGDSKDLLRVEQLKEIEGVCISNLVIPGDPQNLRQQLSSFYIGKDLDFSGIEKIKQDLYLYYEKHGVPFVLVTLPEQNVTRGVVQFIIAKPTLEKITVENKGWNSEKGLKHYLGVKVGEEIDHEKIANRLNFINRHPFRRVELIYAPGRAPRTTDITLVVHNKRPERFYTGTDNTGIETIGRSRLFAGFEWGRPLILDTFLNCQYTTSYDGKTFRAINAQYIAFFPWCHLLNLYGGYTALHASVPNAPLKNHGYNSQTSLRYLIPLKMRRNYSHSLAIGGDFKRIENSLEFSEEFLVFAKKVNLTQCALTYTGNFEGKNHALDFNADFFCSLGSWLPDQANRRFDALRPGAKNAWVYLQGALKYLHYLPDGISLHTWIRSQWALETLLTNEEMGIGGYDTVRGYEEHQLNTDNGFLLNIELRSAPWSLMRFKRWRDVWTLLLFLDYGVGSNYRSLPGEGKGGFLASAGSGLRYILGSYLTARLDIGIKLHRNEIFSGGKAMVHFSLIASY